MEECLNKCMNFIECIARKILRRVSALLHKEFCEETVNGFAQFIKFGIVGMSNVIVSYVVYVISLIFFRNMGLIKLGDYIVAQSVSFALSVLWSFFWNNRMVFAACEGQKRSTWKALLKTYISYSVTGLFLNNALLVLWIQIFHISEFIAPFLSLTISVPINFLMNKFWTFQD